MKIYTAIFLYVSIPSSCSELPSPSMQLRRIPAPEHVLLVPPLMYGITYFKVPRQPEDVHLQYCNSFRTFFEAFG